MSTANQINTMEVVRPMADGIIALAMISAMSSSFGAMGMAAGMSGFSGPYEELQNLNKRISRLNYVLENQKEAVRGTRTHKAKLMQEYGLTVLPSVVEMKKYPKLSRTDYLLRKAEQGLDRMEVSMISLQRRRKELQVGLGVRAEEEEVRRVYPAMKKFVEPRRREF